VIVAPGGKVAYAANLLTGDISEYALNSSTGQLTFIANVSSGTGAASGAGWLATASAGAFLYVANSYDQSVSVFSINQSTAALTAVGTTDGSQTGGFLVSVAIDPSGKFGYAVNNAGNMFQFQRNASTGVLSPNGSVSAGNAPWTIAFAVKK